MPFRRLASIALAALSAWTAAQPAAAQHVQPEAIQYAPRPGSEPRIRGGVEGRFDYYVLALSWSPTFCASDEARPGEPQCRPRPRPYAFVLHGLWPQYERGFPEYCPTPERPFVPQSTIDRILEVMPSRNLVIYQYRKHGVCSGLGAESYFSRARDMFERVKIPKRFVEPADNQIVDKDAVVDEFVAANPGLRREMLAVVCGGPGNRLREVRVCFTKEGQFRACGTNENARRLCSAERVFVPPVRLGRGSEPEAGRPQRGLTLPGPVAPGGRNL